MKGKDIIKIFILDIETNQLNTKIQLSGIVDRKKVFQSRELGVWLRDLTGIILCVFSNEEYKGIEDRLMVGNRINLIGEVALNSRGNRIVKKIDKVEIMGRINDSIYEYSDELQEHASKFLISRILDISSNILTRKKHIKIESKLLSSTWVKDGLEPIQAVYPGFGSAAFLSISPTAQILEFMTDTLLDRVFTVTNSFSTTYRFPEGSPEMKIICSKSVNLGISIYKELLYSLIEGIYNQFIRGKISIVEFSENWKNRIEFESKNILGEEKKGEIALINYNANIPVVGKYWNSNIQNIFQVKAKGSILLVEGFVEVLRNGTEIYSLIIYPSQFLVSLRTAPRRNLQNLVKIYGQT